MPVIGKDCHLILQHEAVNGGQPYGFVCPKDHSPREGGVQVVREVTSDSTDETNATTGTQLWFNFDVLLADDLVNPRWIAAFRFEGRRLCRPARLPRPAAGDCPHHPGRRLHQPRRAGLVSG